MVDPRHVRTPASPRTKAELRDLASKLLAAAAECRKDEEATVKLCKYLEGVTAKVKAMAPKELHDRYGLLPARGRAEGAGRVALHVVELSMEALAALAEDDRSAKTDRRKLRACGLTLPTGDVVAHVRKLFTKRELEVLAEGVRAVLRPNFDPCRPELFRKRRAGTRPISDVCSRLVDFLYAEMKRDARCARLPFSRPPTAEGLARKSLMYSLKVRLRHINKLAMEAAAR